MIIGKFTKEGDNYEGTMHTVAFSLSDVRFSAVSAKQASGQLNAVIAQLPPVFREVIILRELEELAYGDIARIAGIPLGTVMSRLSRARSLLRAAVLQETKGTSDEPAR